MNGDIGSNAEVHLTQPVAAMNRQTPVPMAAGMPSQTSLSNNISHNVGLPISSQPTIPQSMKNIGKSSSNIPPSPRMSPQSSTPRQSPSPAVNSNASVAPVQTQLNNTLANVVGNIQTNHSQMPTAPISAKVSIYVMT